MVNRGEAVDTDGIRADSVVFVFSPGFPQREIKKARWPSAREPRTKIIKTRARFAAAAFVVLILRNLLAEETSVDNGPVHRLASSRAENSLSAAEHSERSLRILPCTVTGLFGKI